MEITNRLVKADQVCDYIPFVSTVSNLIDLFQKYVVLPFLQQDTINASRYYQHLQQKSFLRCFALIIPILGNIIVGIYDMINRSAVTLEPTHKPAIGDPVTVNDIEKVVIGGECKESWPCQHRSEVILKDGRTGILVSGSEVWSIISKLSKDQIQSKYGSVDKVIEHFQGYSQPRSAGFPGGFNYAPKSPEKVLNRIF